MVCRLRVTPSSHLSCSYSGSKSRNGDQHRKRRKSQSIESEEVSVERKFGSKRFKFVKPLNITISSGYRQRVASEWLIYRPCLFSYKLLQSNGNATLAQLVERLIRNQQVAGSIPAGGSSLNL
jgi:hypothetical protein